MGNFLQFKQYREKCENYPQCKNFHVYNIGLVLSFWQIHWFSIFNSFMMVIFLVGLVSMILMRTLRKDYARYSKEEDLDDMVSSLYIDQKLWYISFFLKRSKLGAKDGLTRVESINYHCEWISVAIHCIRIISPTSPHKCIHVIRATDKARKSVITHWKLVKTHWKNKQGVKIRISISLYALGVQSSAYWLAKLTRK